MKRLFALLLLAACAKPPEITQSPGDVPGLLRNPTAPIASQADVTAARLEGEWYVRQAALSGTNLYETALLEDIGNGAFTLSVCQSSDCDVFRLNQTGPGRWALDSMTPRSPVPLGEVWVLWMEFDDRTVVIGDTLANYVWILDRGKTGGGDRIAAARDILKWYGYDLSQLETVQ